MAKKIPGLGTQLQATIASALTTIVHRVSIDGPDSSVGTKDITDLDSAAVEKGITLADGGDLSLQVWLDPNDSTHQFLAQSSAAPSFDPTVYKLLFNTSPARSGTFSAFVTGYKPGGMSADGYLTADVKLTITGVVTWA